MKNHTPQYYIAYERDNGGYIAPAPAIPGCMVYGKTLKQAYASIQIAIQECFAVIREFKSKKCIYYRVKHLINYKKVARISIISI